MKLDIKNNIKELQYGMDGVIKSLHRAKKKLYVPM